MQQMTLEERIKMKKGITAYLLHLGYLFHNACVSHYRRHDR